MKPRSETNYAGRLGVAQHDFRLVLGGSKIDFCSKKEAANRKNHGYSLESGVDLLGRLLFPFGGSSRLVTRPCEGKGEIRHEHMGVADDGKVVFFVTTMRADETVRVISFRRAHESERAAFKSLTGYVEA